MNTSKVIFENKNYVVCLIKPGLSVQKKKTGIGRLLSIKSDSFSEWLLAFENSDGHSESNALAQAFFTN